MAWQDQGRQRHMWFGHGKAPEKLSSPGIEPRAPTRGSDAERASGLVYGSIAALPPAQRAIAEEQLRGGTLDRLTTALAIWMRSAHLDPARFAERYFGRNADDRTAANIHGAVLAADLARNPREMRPASEKLAAAIMAVGSNHWPRFVAEAQAHAERVAASGLEDVTPVPLVDDNGQTVLDRDGKPMLRPAGMDPHFFVAQGLKDRETEDAMISNGGGMDGVPEALAYEFAALAHFNRGAAWDAQRVGGVNHQEFVNYATVAIGLYAAANGISREEILEIENIVAITSHFDPRKKKNDVYTHLLEENVQNTDIGYDLYQSGRIGPAASRR